MQTLGSLVDQLGVVNLKMWNSQEELYEIRRMSFEEFLSAYSDEESMNKLYLILKKACDLNVQRNEIIDEIDSFIVTLVKNLQADSVNIDSLSQKKNKTY
jgi:hypothetical protein